MLPHSLKAECAGHWQALLDYRGIWADRQPLTGHSDVDCHALQVFDVDAVECWLMKQPDKVPPKASKGGSSSVLDKFKEDRHLVNLAGRNTQASTGVREARPEDDL